VPSSKTPVSRPGAAIATAAERTRSVIEDLQSRLSGAGAARPGIEPQADASESEDELERQLRAYFADQPEERTPDPQRDRKLALDDLRQRVVDRVADRILEEWERSHPAAWNQMREEVIARLVERVLVELQNEP
jgi:hypothetical protein